MDNLRFISPLQVRRIADTFDTPCYVYDEATLTACAEAALAFPNAFGLTVRYAMKASPNAAILKHFHTHGLHIDASSEFEVRRAIAAGIPAEHISLSSQQLPDHLNALLETGIQFKATSLNQLRAFAETGKTELGLRFNPGLGSGGTAKTNVGGPASSFGIWHELAAEAKAICEEHGLTVTAIHSHIGSGSDPAVWLNVVDLNLALVRMFPDVSTLNLGGGFKVGRMADEVSTDLQVVGAPVKQQFEAFAAETGRELKLEIEPGTFLLGNAGAIVSRVQDIVDTGKDGYTFIRADTGMTEVLRPSLYAAQHPITVVPREEEPRDRAKYIVVGHCCESGDLLTPSPDDPEALAPRELAKAEIGDYLVIDGAGAYCSAMSAKNYNSFPEAAEVMLQADGEPRLIRKRQPAEQVWQNEV